MIHLQFTLARVCRCAMQQAYALYLKARMDPAVCDLDIVLLHEQRHDRSAMIYYPVNVLRNMARLQVSRPRGRLDEAVHGNASWTGGRTQWMVGSCQVHSGETIHRW